MHTFLNRVLFLWPMGLGGYGAICAHSAPNVIPPELLGSIASSTKDSQMFVLSQKWVDAFSSGPRHMTFLLDPLLC